MEDLLNARGLNSLSNPAAMTVGFTTGKRCFGLQWRETCTNPSERRGGQHCFQPVMPLIRKALVVILQATYAFSKLKYYLHAQARACFDSSCFTVVHSIAGYRLLSLKGNKARSSIIFRMYCMPCHAG